MNADLNKKKRMEEIPELSAQQITELQGRAFPKIISFESLARCGEEIWIENGGQIYRLQRTKQGKLILTK